MSNDTASSGLLTSLAVISFCIASVLVLSSIMSGCMSSSFYHVVKDDLNDKLDTVLEKMAEDVTEVSFDGYRYLRPDWEMKIEELNVLDLCSDCDFIALTLRCFNHDDIRLVLKNNNGNLEFELKGSLPFYIVFLNMKKPGEIVITVGI